MCLPTSQQAPAASSSHASSFASSTAQGTDRGGMTDAGGARGDSHPVQNQTGIRSGDFPLLTKRFLLTTEGS